MRELILSIEEDIKNLKDHDEWGLAQMCDGDIGIDFNYYIENGEQHSSMCLAVCIGETMSDCTQCSRSYNIMWDKPNWKELLVRAMRNFLDDITHGYEMISKEKVISLAKRYDVDQSDALESFLCELLDINANELYESLEPQSVFAEESFIDDFEKMKDFKILSKEEFLASYSYISETEYDATKKYLEWLKGDTR